MLSEEKKIVQRVVENYVRTGLVNDNEVKVASLPNNKTSFVEKIGDDGRSILLDEYRVDDKIIWAAYSTRTGTVYLSTTN